MKTTCSNLLLLALAWLSCIGSITAQNIVRAEYYLDADPGFGSGTSIAITPGATVDQNFTINVSAIPLGFHTLFVRSKDANGTWSMPMARPFYKDIIPTGTTPNIVQAEYYLDADPGFGSGTSIAITPSTTIDQNFTINVSAIPLGFHTLFVRLKDANGKWSMPMARPFYKDVIPTGTTPNIVQAEYYLDADPGFGSGTSITISPGTTIDQNFIIDVSTIPLGPHTLFVRSKDANGKWSSPFAASFTKTALLPPTIASISPASGPVGTTVTITGTNFDLTPGNNIVMFNGVAAAVTASTATSITTSVPVGATTGTVAVTVSGQTGTSASNFTVTLYPSQGNSIDFSTSTDKILAPVPTTSVDNFTLEAWINPSVLPFPIFGAAVSNAFDNGSSGNGIAFGIGAGFFGAGSKLQILYSGNAIVETNYTFPAANQWYHVAVVRSGGITTAYVNGAAVTPTFTTAPIIPTAFSIGNQSNINRSFIGKIDEVRVWNIARTQSQIQSTINSTLVGNETALQAYYKMDEVGQGAGISVQNSATATGAALNGTTVGTPCTPIFTLTPAPTIGSFSPASGPTGTAVTITGTNFSTTPANNIVKFNGVTATVTASTATSITTVVPAGATSGPIEITAGCNTVTSATNFTVLPIPLAGLKLWLRADDIALPNNSPVATWTDASGSSNNFTASGAARPTFKSNGCPGLLNGKPYVNFDFGNFLSRNDVLGMAPNTSRTFIAVYKMNNPSIRCFAVEQGDFSSPGTYFGLDANTFNTVGNRFGVFATNNSFDSNVPTDTQYHIQFLQASSMAVGANVISDISYRIDDNLTTLNLRAGSGTYQSFATANEMRIWGFMDFAEVFAYDRVLTNTERANIVAYLQAKYVFAPIPLPPTIASFTPTTGNTGTAVTITGTNFSTTPANNIVKFNGVTATVTASTATSITTVVPAGATTGPIEITVGCNTVTSATSFSVPYVPQGNVIELNGSTDFVVVADNATLRPSDLTLEAWVKFSSLPSNGFAPIITKVLGSGINNSFALWYLSGTLNGNVNNVASQNTPVQITWTPTLGQWYHLGFTFNNATKAQSLYIDGVAVSTNTAIASPAYDNSSVRLGADVDSGITYTSPVSIDEARIWNVARTPLQLLSTINTSLAGNEPGLVAYYKMDEVGRGAGISVQNGATATGTALNGTTVGTACTPIFTLTPVPTISSFSPASGPIGTAITITGTNFSTTPANNIVKFNGVTATITASTATTIAAGVPAGTTTGPIEVTVGCNTVTSASNFTVGASVPSITSFTPTTGSIGTTVTITGTNFSTTLANNIVYFGATGATVSAATATQLTVTVPTGATYQPITVQVAGVTAFSSKPFVVTFAGGGSIDACSFTPAVTIASVNTQFLNRPAFADIDEDGKPDLIIPESLSNQFSIFRNISTVGSVTAGSFAAPVSIPALSQPLGLAVGDLDGDGKRDLAVLTYTAAKVSIYKNLSTSGSISLATKVDFDIPNFAHDISIADIDGDGKLDVALTSSFNGLTVLRNTGTPGVINASTFAAGINFTTGSNPQQFALGDLDGDGKLDAAVSNSGTNTISLLRNISTPGIVSFATHVLLTTADAAYSTVLGDIDGDNTLDLVVSNITANTYSLIRNTSTVGTFSFDPKYDLPSIAGGNTAALGDFDGDGKIDLATNYGSTSIAVYKNLATSGIINASSFSSPVTFPRLASSVLLNGDVDGDGRNEIVTTGFTLQVFRNVIGTISPPTISSFSPSSGSVGTSVTITGTNFGTPFTNTIEFNGVPAPITASTATSLTVTVPVGATTGPIEVTIGCNSVTTVGNFTIDCLPIIASSFDSGFDGWSVTTSEATGPIFNSNGGNPGGFLTATDLGSDYWFWIAPAKFRGNLSGAYGGILKFDLIAVTALPNNDFQDVILSNGVTNLVFDTPSNPGTGWNSYFAKLDENAGWRVGTLAGTLATKAQIESVLSNVTSLQIRGEYQNGIETIGIDNVVIVPIAAPVVGNVSGCANTGVTLSASGATGTQQYRWYDMPTGGTPLSSSVNFTTPALTNTTSYYAAIVNTTTGCESSRAQATAFINPLLSIKAVSDFSSNLDGWTRLSNAEGVPGVPNYISSGGNPGGYIEASDIANDTWYWNAPAKFLLSDMTNAVLSFDFKATIIPYFSERDIVIKGAGLTLHADLFTIENLSADWKNFIFTFDPTLPWYKGNYSARTLATPAEVQAAFQNITQLSIRGEFKSGDDTSAVDNAIISSRSLPTGVDGQGCVNTSITLNSTGATGTQEYRWYDLPNGGNLLSSTGSFATPLLLATTTYYVSLIDPVGGCRSNRVPVIATILPAPTITFFTPTGTIGSPVTITGTNFSTTPANNIVKFNGVTATVTASTATSITAIVPAGATTGSIEVTVGCNTVTSASNFTVNPAPTSANASVTSDEDVTFTFANTSFPFTDDGTFSGIEIASLETTGDLEYNGVDVVLNQLCPDVTLLAFKPALNANGSLYATFDFKVRDNDGVLSLASYIMTINVTPVNDPPLITGQLALSTPKATARTILITDIAVSDPDNTVFTLSVQDGISYTRVGNTITPDAGFNGSLSVPVTVNDGTVNSGIFNLIICIIPDAPTGIPGESCGSGTVNLSATGATALQQYRWYDSAIGGSLLASSAAFATPVITATTSYYVSIFEPGGGCESARSEVIATVKPGTQISFTNATGYTASYVSPAQGAQDALFEFRIIYTNVGGFLPGAGYPRVELDANGNNSAADPLDIIRVMQEADATDTDVIDGKEYRVTITNLSETINWRSRIVARNTDGCQSETSFVTSPFVSNDLLDVAIFANDISFSKSNPAINESIKIYARIRNTSDYLAENFVVSAYIESNRVFTQTVSLLGPQASITLQWDQSFAVAGFYPVKVVIDELNVLAEDNELNNFAIRPVIAGDYQLPGGIDCGAAVSPTSILPFGGITISGSAQYFGILPSVDPDVAGATVTARITGGGQASTTTRADGTYQLSLSAPSTPGTYTVTVEVTDFTLTGTQGPFTITVLPSPPSPDLVSSIVLNQSTLLPGQPASGTATVQNIGDAPATNFIFQYLNCDAILGTQPIPLLNPGESLTFNFTATPNVIGDCFNRNNCAFRSEADVTGVVTERSEANNQAVTHLTVLPDKPDLTPVNNTNAVIPGSVNMLTPQTFYIRVDNIGGVNATTAFDVRVYMNGTLIHTEPLTSLATCVGHTFPVSYTFATTLDHVLDIRVDEPIGSGAVDEYRENNNEYSRTIRHIPPPPAFSNLNVGNGDISVTPALPGTGTNFNINVAYRNNGSVAISPPFELELTVIEAGIPRVETRTINTAFNAGASSIVTLTTSLATDSNHAFRIRLDHTALITEGSEGDNVAQMPLCVDFVASPGGGVWGGGFYQGTVQNLTASIYNSGLFTATNVPVSFFIDNVKVASTSLPTVGPSLQSGNYTVSLPYLFATAGTFELKVVVDELGAYTECREDNNEFKQLIQVLVPAPDLRIFSEYISPSKINPDVDEPITIFISYDNVGVGASGPFKARVLVDDVPLGSDVNIPSVSPGDDGTVQLTTPYRPALAGIRVIRALLDPDDLLNETTRTNNEASRALVVGQAPNLLFSNLQPNVICPNNGDNVTITAIVRNTGDIQASAEIHFFYLTPTDTIPIDNKTISVAGNQTASVQIDWLVINKQYALYAEIRNSNPVEFDESDNFIRTNFCAGPYFNLQVNVLGQGIVQRTPNQNRFEGAQLVEITAAAANGWTFSGWQGDATGSANPLTLNVNANRNIEALFTELLSTPVGVSAARCGPGAIMLSASGAMIGQTYVWYTQAVGGTPIQNNALPDLLISSLTLTTSYYVAIRGVSDESPRVEVVATINTIPAVSSTTGASGCGPFALALTATGGSSGQYRWYTVAAGGTAIAGETNLSYTTPTLTSTTTYYVAVNNGTCESARTPVTAIIDSLPVAPTTTPANRCDSGTVTLAASGGTAGQYRWYTLPTGGTAIAGETNSSYTSPTLTNTTTYYVAVNNGTCESTRTAVTATIDPLPAAPTTTPANRCDSGPVTLTASGGSAGQYRWYTVATGGTAIAGEVNASFIIPSLASTTTYYVAISNGTCESSRTAVVAVIDPLPAAPTAANINRCGNGTVTLTASGGTAGQYRWYLSASSGAAIAGETNATFTSPPLTTTTTYYVATNNGTCESTRSPATATIDPVPVAPTAANVNRCDSGTVTLTASGGTVGQYRWYLSPSGGTAIAGQTNPTYTIPTLTATTTYYVALNNGTCEGTRTSVVATINNLPAKPTIQTSGSTGICNGQSVTLAAPAGFTYLWSNGATTQQITVTTAGNFTVQVNDGTCASVLSDPVTVTVVSCNQPPAIATTTASTNIEGRVAINLSSLISDPDDNLDFSTLRVVVQPVSGASTEFIGQNLIINYEGINFAGLDKLTIEICDFDGVCTRQELSIEVMGDIIAYNGLSPNGDNKNPIFHIKYIDALPETKENKVFIYNRWGDRVWQGVNYNNTTVVFTGQTNEGNDLPTGTYFYKIEFASGKSTVTGYLSLKR